MTFTTNELIEIGSFLFALVGVYVKLNNRIIRLQVLNESSTKQIQEIKDEMKEIEDHSITSIKEVKEALNENSSAVRELKAVINQMQK